MDRIPITLKVPGLKDRYGYYHKCCDFDKNYCEVEIVSHLEKNKVKKVKEPYIYVGKKEWIKLR